MSADVLIATGMIVVILGVAAWELILSYSDDRQQTLLAAMDAVKRAERERELIAEAASLAAQESGEHDQVTLDQREERLFAEIAGQFGAAVCACGHSKEAHEHYRTGSDCSGCECRRYRRRAPNATRRTA